MNDAETLALGKKRAKELNLTGYHDEHYRGRYYHAEDVHKLLGSSKQLYGYKLFSNNWRFDDYRDHCETAAKSTHTCLAIGIREIQPESAESLLREYVSLAGNCEDLMWKDMNQKKSFVERARALLAKGPGYKHGQYVKQSQCPKDNE